MCTQSVELTAQGLKVQQNGWSFRTVQAIVIAVTVIAVTFVVQHIQQTWAAIHLCYLQKLDVKA